jgi:hypothetical protein
MTLNQYPILFGGQMQQKVVDDVDQNSKFLYKYIYIVIICGLQVHISELHNVYHEHIHHLSLILHDQMVVCGSYVIEFK